MVKKIQTLGYEGLTIEEFVGTLLRSKTQIVVDVRANPLSRKAGFSKKSFALHLEAAGIAYLHVAGVGCPKPVRDQYKEDGDWAIYTAGYLAHLKGRRADVIELAEVASKLTACLVCFEADYERCHRSFVADAIAAKGGQSIQHLIYQRKTAGHLIEVAA